MKVCLRLNTYLQWEIRRVDGPHKVSDRRSLITLFPRETSPSVVRSVILAEGHEEVADPSPQARKNTALREELMRPKR